MRTYDQLRALEGTSELVSYAGGRRRYVNWRRHGHAVIGALMGHDIITATPHYVRVTTAGHNTPSTVEALSVALYGAPGVFYNYRGELYHGGERMTDGMTLDYDGRVVSHGPTLSPMRGADAERRGDVVDVVTSGRARQPVAEMAARRLLRNGERLKLAETEHPNVYTFRVLR